MKHAAIILFALLAAGLALRAAPLASDTLVYASPTTAARVTGTLAAGTVTQPVTSPATLALPSGWQAFERAESQDCWVRDSDLDKELNVKPGTLLHAAASVESPVTGTMAEDDLSEVRDIQGRWVQVHCTKRIIGYYQTGTTPAAAATTSSTVTVTATANTPDRLFIDRSLTLEGQRALADVALGDTLPPGIHYPVQPQVTANLVPRLALLANDTPVYEYPWTTSTILGILPAGTVTPPYNGLYALNIPFEGGVENWKIIEYGPSQDCWVRDDDLDKWRNVKSGTLLHAAPNADAAVIGTMSVGDTSELCDNQGKWVKVHYKKHGMGFIQTPAYILDPDITFPVDVALITVTATTTATTATESPQSK